VKKHSDQEIYRSFEEAERFFQSTMAGHRRHALLFEPYGITPTEYRVLTFLLGHPDGVEPSVAADSLRVLRQSMTKLVDTLEQRGLVLREAHPTDRRRVNLRLQPKGVELARELSEIHMDYFNRVLARFTEEELETFRTLHWRMDAAYDEELNAILRKNK